MEIIIVGWHFPDAPYICQDCPERAEFLVSYKGNEWDSFNLCSRCANKHTVIEDKIEKIFRNLGL